MIHLTNLESLHKVNGTVKCHLPDIMRLLKYLNRERGYFMWTKKKRMRVKVRATVRVKRKMSKMKILQWMNKLIPHPKNVKLISNVMFVSEFNR